MPPLLPTAPYRGTRDFLPEEMSVRTQVFSRLYETIETFGFQRYDGPVLEPVEIYEAKSGQELVERQLYVLTDKADRRLALRPEMTPSVARMIAANAGRLSFPVRWYSHPNCHRYEKPQKGRVREHWQINVDVFGSESVEAEVEIFELIHALFRTLGADPSLYEIRVNDRGLAFSALERFVGLAPEQVKPVFQVLDRWEKLPREVCLEQLAGHGLDAAAAAKVEAFTKLDFPAFVDAAAPEVRGESRVARILNEGLLDGPLRFDPLIVRGLDYYTSTVFEVFDVSPENRRSIFGGGRYDNLTALFSKQRIPGIGFGLGDVTLMDFLETHELKPAPDVSPDAVVLCAEPSLRGSMKEVAARLREAGVKTVTPLDGGGLGKELKKAAKLGARVAVLVGAEEHGRGAVIVRDLARSEQREVAATDVASEVGSTLAR